MHPQLLTFLKLTGLVAAAIAAFLILSFVTGLLVKVVLIAALVAALIMGGFFVYNAFVRRKQLPASTK
jgi:hypothetical protein